MTSIETVTVGGSAMEIHVARPPGTEPCPALLLIYHREGYDDFTASLMRRYSQAGYLVAVPDVSHRTPRSVPMTDRKAYLRDSEVIADLRATADYLHARTDVRHDRIAIVGHCMGGRMCFLGASTIAGLQACVVFYGGGMLVSWNETTKPIDLLDGITCPVIHFSGDLDQNPSPEQVDKVEAELVRLKIPHQFHRYSGVGHGFQNRPQGSPQEQAASADSWDKALHFLATHLAPVTAAAGA